MVIFLYGEDSYRSKQKLDEIIDQYKKVRKSALNLIYADAGEIDFADFYNNFKISPMFSEKKLVVLKNVFLNKEFQEDFLEEIKNLESFKDVIVVHESQTADQRTKLFKSLTKGKSQEFKLLDGKNIKTWVQKEFVSLREISHSEKKLNQDINNDALDLLLSYAGRDLWRLSSEIKKLADFKNGAVVKKDDIELHVRPNIETEIFKTIDAIGQKNKRQALAFLQKHLENGDSPFYVLSMIAYQFKNLLIVKELAQKGMMYASIVKKSGLHPFVVKKTYFMCNQFSFEELKRIYRNIFQIDAAIKIGKIEAETALDLLIAQI
ncbi:MAG: DNA polymerase III subunit delta [Candidatus Staskawiczbacteria bacterium RIFCSPHIGHO2_12_FULL_38_11]|uniref:DNA polymerase III subunit delta n=1 Tax=Candidatus Staskawiczbacteria bacterium RIFCSPHIGHO2_12_FULL_38_11 TaxID=1802209 RepID=A0A1G2I8B2_9BACT|nr:MAG: DNA polymerase III subunit delta [Candidatus Staskawiczbacteria bacterium RIFCSPHIGHO2_12_FULL_38_11]